MYIPCRSAAQLVFEYTVLFVKVRETNREPGLVRFKDIGAHIVDLLLA